MRKKQQPGRSVVCTTAPDGQRARVLLFFCSLFCTTLYIVWRLCFTLPVGHGAAPLALGIILWIAEAMAALESLVQYRQIVKRMVPKLPQIPKDWYPDVDVLVATHNESVELLYKTVNACTYLHYPDPAKVHIYICDDTNRPEMAELASKLGVGYFGMSEMPMPRRAT